MAERLRLLAQDAADLPVLSALLQDAAVAAANVHYDPRARRLVLLLSRYRWEARGRTRVASALRIDGVLRAERRAWPGERDAVLALLALRLDGDVLTVQFSGGADIRLTVEAVDMVLEDLGEARAAASAPRHAA